MEEIKAGDIMIGNWFYMNGFPMYVDSIFRDTVYLEFEGNEGDVWEENIKDLTAIPLTEDILLKAGFKKKSFTLGIEYVHIKPYIFLSVKNDKFKYAELEIKHLHQLQNLFKSITGNDLNIEV